MGLAGLDYVAHKTSPAELWGVTTGYGKPGPKAEITHNVATVSQMLRGHLIAIQ